MEFALRPLAASDRPWLREFMRAYWGAEEMVDRQRGLRLAALYPDAVDEARRLKPEIPRVGESGIPLRDELELELDLN
jgi:hypothetical protein